MCLRFLSFSRKLPGELHTCAYDFAFSILRYMVYLELSGFPSSTATLGRIYVQTVYFFCF